ncbi:hypothetical protein A5658_04720 [Mycobacterium sp. 1245111.1]|uniref:hypothetical protein n=1 Tax=Mycobacterium sp. 1245111.1 TaxID=1834073 RepID=UPI0008017704|nr:hypothetical protein [Mycobacterium sp. 1245111.1]OBK36967.1 hypothetical protein A5658_04720 [Mycobacterium sp. 1245111.1]
MSTSNSSSWPVPDGLCPLGQTAAATLWEFFVHQGIEYHGGGGKFYTPAQWAERGETGGRSSVLVVTHDGGEHAGAFNLDYEQYELNNALNECLSSVGLYAEQCTSWYSAIYPRAAVG